MTEPESNWLDTMPRDDRVKACQQIIDKLSAYYRTVPIASVKERISAFESQVYSRATSRSDYLEKMAEGLSGVEAQTRGGSQDAAAGQVAVKESLASELGRCRLR